MAVKQVTCSRCGAVYELRSEKIPLRDRDQFRCSVCHTTLEAWDGGVMWSGKLITRGPDIPEGADPHTPPGEDEKG
jgi:predicted Zn finger-like uncharacterized protein